MENPGREKMRVEIGFENCHHRLLDLILPPTLVDSGRLAKFLERLLKSNSEICRNRGHLAIGSLLHSRVLFCKILTVGIFAVMVHK